MKRMRLLLQLVCASLAAASCFGIEEEHFRTLEPITVLTQSDTINAQLGTELHYTGITVLSNLPVTCEWSYGSPKENTTVEQHQFSSRIVLDTDSPALDYTFTRLGSYILRLKVDNGESIAYKFFRLNVNSGYDEGIAILSNAEDGTADITFIKTLTAEEKARGDEEIFHIDPTQGLRNGVGLFMTNTSLSYGAGDQAALMIATADGQGSIYLLDPKTLEVITSAQMAEYGTVCKEIGGEYARVSDMGSFFLAEDGRVFRFDLMLGYLTEIEGFPDGLKRAYGAVNRTIATGASTISPFFFTEDAVYTRSSGSSGIKSLSDEGYAVVNVAAFRTVNTNPIAVLLRSKSDPSSCRIRRSRLNPATGIGITGWEGDPYDFTAADLKMDSQSKMLGSKASNDVYYTYDNAVYRWGLSTAPGTRPAITVPAGEQIRTLATNFMGKAASGVGGIDAGEDRLYIATYNPARPGDKKGSLYIYRFSDDELETAYEGICNDPADVIYKYRLN